MATAEERGRALRTARVLWDMGYPIEEVLANSAIPEEVRAWIREQLELESNQTFERARVISGSPGRREWLAGVDRSEWYYWPTLRNYLLGVKGRSRDIVLSLDDASDRILRELAPPSKEEFDIRGLVLGYIQSGKTANFTALVAKAVDAGYRLVIVFSGVDNGLRRQTQIRLNRELTGYPDGRSGAVRMPRVGLQWHQFTSDSLAGDFDAGRANHAALQGSQPVLIVVKKNGPVLRRLRAWLQSAPADVRASLPALFIDDEADQASVDARGSYQTEDGFDETAPDYEPPTVINGLIRELLGLFVKRAYVAYTATPFSNLLIPHDNYDGGVGADLYPKDFFIDLPKPQGYFGTEEFFGRFDPVDGDEVDGLDVIRIVSPEEVVAFTQNGVITPSLDEALHSFILGGAARAVRGEADAPCTMLVHTSQRIADQGVTRSLVERRFRELKDEWRYDRQSGIYDRLSQLWERDFVPTSAGVAGAAGHRFVELEQFIGTFLESVVIREINSDRGEVLDYELEPALKAIAVGGNRLSRGLTLEGLLVSYFARRSLQYDTLLQMARWFGYRGGYVDLTRIFTTRELASWFTDLALVETRLRADMRVYEQLPDVRPADIGMRILQHPVMQVTSALKRRFATSTTLRQSYSGDLAQTFKFPLEDEDGLALQSERNQLAAQTLIRELRGEVTTTKFGPQWTGVGVEPILRFLREFQVDPVVNSLSPELIAAWVERQNVLGELTNWTVVIRGRDQPERQLGSADWIPESVGKVWNVARTRIKGTNSLGVITSPGDEAFGLTVEEVEEMKRKIAAGEESDRNRAARLSRNPQSALLLLYPISKYSGSVRPPKGREPLFENPSGGSARDLLGVALSFPRSASPQFVEAYLEGTARWRPAA